MIETILLAGEPINPRVPDASGIQMLFAWGAAAIIAMAVFLAIMKLKSPAIDGDRGANRDKLTAALASLRSKSVVIEKGAAIEEFRTTFHEMTNGSDPDQTTAKQEFRTAVGDVRSAWTSRTPNVPQLSLRLAWQSLLVSILGSVAVVSLETWKNATETGGDGLSLADLAYLIEEFATLLHTGATAFPFSGFVWELSLAYGIQLLTILYSNWLPLSLFLLIGAVAVALIDRATTDALELTLIKSKRFVVSRAAGGIALVWVSGVIFSVLGDVIQATTGVVGFAGLGDVVGFGVSFLVGVSLAGYATLRFAQSVRETHSDLENSLNYYFPDVGLSSHGQAVTATAILAWKTAALASYLIIPFLLAWSLSALIEGKLLAVVGILLAAPLATKLPLLVAAVSIIAVISLDNPARWTETRAALSHAMSKNRVRAFAFAQGIPVTVIVLLVLVGWTIKLPLVITLPVALLVGVAVRIAWTFYAGAKYQYLEREEPDKTPQRAVVAIPTAPLADATGREIFRATVNGHAIAWPERDQFLDALLRDVEAVFRDGSPPASIEEYYHREMIDHGLTDPTHVIKKHRGDILLQVEAAIRDGGSADAHRLRDQLRNQYDNRVVEEQLAYLIEESNKLVEEGGVFRFRTGSSALR